MRTALLIGCLLGCEADRLTRIPDEPDAGLVQNVGADAQGADASSPDSLEPDAGDPSAPECVPAEHIPTACRSGQCWGAVLCVAGALHCVAPACEQPPETDECEGPDYAFVVDRSGSMAGYNDFLRAATSSLTADPNRNYFFVDVPGVGLEPYGPGRGCYHPSQPYPLPPCLDPSWSVRDFGVDHWGWEEYVLNALHDLPSTVGWTPGRRRHAFVFADEMPQGTVSAQQAVARLLAARIRVHLWVGPNLHSSQFAVYEQIATATGGTIQTLLGETFDPCP